MPFAYAATPLIRRHGPVGYADYGAYKDWLRDDFAFRCAYCLVRERWFPSGADAFGVDHIKPKADPRYRGLLLSYTNLVYACNRCNAFKQDAVLLDPTRTALAEHLRVSAEGAVHGVSPEGRRLIRILDLDAPEVQAMRHYFLRLLALWRRYPNDGQLRSLALHAFGYPAGLPNLKMKRPQANTRPRGVGICFFQLHA